MDGKLPTLSRNDELLVKLAMFQKKRSLLGWKDSMNEPQCTDQKIFGTWTSLVAFSKRCLIID